MSFLAEPCEVLRAHVVSCSALLGLACECGAMNMRGGVGEGAAPPICKTYSISVEEASGREQVELLVLEMRLVSTAIKNHNQRPEDRETRGPGDQDQGTKGPGTRGPGDQKTGDQRTRGPGALSHT